MAVPYIFATTPGNGTIPLANLDANFAYLLNSPTLNNLIVSGSTSLNGPLLFGNQIIPGVTGTNTMVLNTSPTLITPNLGTPSYLNLVNAINLPIGSITGFGSNIEAFLINPNSSTLAYAVSDETGTGQLVFNNTPTLTTPLINNPQVSSGSFQAPTMVSPILGTPASGNLQNCTNFPVSGLTGTGAGVITALQATPNNVSGFVTYNGSAGNLNVTSTVYKGSTSGTITVQAVPVAGAQQILLPAASGTVLLDSTVVGVAAGVVTFFAANAPPAGWLVCDGNSYPVASYQNLFAVIGYSYGGSGANFNVPNLQGLFLRGFGGNSGAFGVQQYDNFGSHTHPINDPGHTHAVTDPTHGHTVTQSAHVHSTVLSTVAGQGDYWGLGPQLPTPPYGIGGSSSPIGPPYYTTLTSPATANITINNASTGITNQFATTSITTSAAGAVETRPVNMALLPIIKY